LSPLPPHYLQKCSCLKNMKITGYRVPKTSLDLSSQSSILMREITIICRVTNSHRW
jgi:hypothetical protein